MTHDILIASLAVFSVWCLGFGLLLLWIVKAEGGHMAPRDARELRWAVLASALWPATVPILLAFRAAMWLRGWGGG